MRNALCAATLAATAVATSALLMPGPADARADDPVDGFRYLMYSASPPESAFDDDPDSFDRVSKRIVWQAPEQTLIWVRDSDVGQPEKASFARGERRMGLLVPFWDGSRNSSEQVGWKDYGKAITYKTFEVQVSPGDDGRVIAGAPAAHYRVEVDLVQRSEDSSADTRIQLSGNVWVHEDKPFSWAPFSTAGMFAEPRMQVALNEQLSALGMVVRAETAFQRQAQDEQGNPLGYPHDSTHLTWVGDLERGPVPVVDVPLATEETVAELRRASRADAAGACRSVAEGGTPQFVKELLNEAQQAAFLPQLEKMCQRRAARQKQGS